MPTYSSNATSPEPSHSPTTSCAGSRRSPTTSSTVSSRPYTWRHSYVAGDKIYCVHEAQSVEDVLEHARCGGFPANLVAEVCGRVRQHRPARAAGLNAASDLARMTGGAIIGRTAERARLRPRSPTPRPARGSLVLVSGEAGVGQDAARRGRARRGDGCRVRARRGDPAGSPYGPLTAAMRGYLRARAGRPDGCGPLRAALALLLPELGRPRRATTARRSFEAIRCGLVAMAASAPSPCCSTTCSGPTRRRSSCWPRSRPIRRAAAAGRRRLPLGRASARAPAPPDAARPAPRPRARAR